VAVDDGVVLLDVAGPVQILHGPVAVASGTP
jgi:hypothetical protein